MQKSQSYVNPNIFKKQNFRKWRSIANFGHFAKAIVRQNGYKMVTKMVDFGNEVLINQLGDWSARLSRKLARVNEVNTVKLDNIQFILFPRIW